MSFPAPRGFSALIKKLAGFLFVSNFFLIILVLLPPSASAQSLSKPNAYAAVENDVPQNAHTYYQVSLIEFSSAIICQLVGIDPISPKTPCLGINPNTSQIGYLPQPTIPGNQGNIPALG